MYYEDKVIYQIIQNHLKILMVMESEIKGIIEKLDYLQTLELI